MKDSVQGEGFLPHVGDVYTFSLDRHPGPIGVVLEVDQKNGCASLLVLWENNIISVTNTAIEWLAPFKGSALGWQWVRVHT